MRESRQPPSFINWSPGDRDVFRALLCLSCFSFVLPSELFCIYLIFLLCCLRSLFVFIPSFSRIAFGIVWCCSCLSSVLPSESSCIYSDFSLCCLRNPLFLVLFLFHICIIFVSYLYCLCFTFVRFLFRIYVAFLFGLCNACVISMMAWNRFNRESGI